MLYSYFSQKAGKFWRPEQKVLRHINTFHCVLKIEDRYPLKRRMN